eukprot:4296218-Amphidinium_carterae.1
MVVYMSAVIPSRVSRFLVYNGRILETSQFIDSLGMRTWLLQIARKRVHGDVKNPPIANISMTLCMSHWESYFQSIGIQQSSTLNLNLNLNLFLLGFMPSSSPVVVLRRWCVKAMCPAPPALLRTLLP